MPPVRLRPLVQGDLAEVTEIERDTFGDPWSRRSFEDLLSQPHVVSLVALGEADRLAGYAMGSLVADEGEILNIAVAVDARRAGIGQKLLEALVEQLRDRGAEHIYLEVRRSNEAAIGLYRAAGFRPLGVRPAYYAKPREDALTMALEPGSQSARKG